MLRLRRRGDKKREERIVGRMLRLRRRGAVNENEEIPPIERVSIFNVQWLEDKNNSKVCMNLTISSMLMNYPLMISFVTLRRTLVQL